ncbi:MAG: hypothetical protein MJZ37_08880 [Bacilli bacterium]|nr:hypothetical protein [Bacilli bacterium]
MIQFVEIYREELGFTYKVCVPVGCIREFGKSDDYCYVILNDSNKEYRIDRAAYNALCSVTAMHSDAFGKGWK